MSGGTLNPRPARPIPTSTDRGSGDRNRVAIVTKAGVEEWPEMTKQAVAERLAALIADRLKTIEV